MATSIYSPLSQRPNGYREKGRMSNGLPSYSPSVVQEKLRHTRANSWIIPIYVPIPGMQTRRLRVPVPNPARFHQLTVSRFGRKRGTLVLCLSVLAMVFTVFALAKRFGSEDREWPKFPGEPPTLVFRREDLQRIWKWEVESGHYPSSQKIPEMVGLRRPIWNPALPPSTFIPSRFRPPPGPFVTNTHRAGAKRVYLDIQSRPPNIAYPPRPVPGSIADLDIIMEHCDFSQQKYVRDCLEVLRIGGGLDNGNRVRRGKVDDWKYIYVEDGDVDNITQPIAVRMPGQDPLTTTDQDPDAGLVKKRGAEWESEIILPPPRRYQPAPKQSTPCNEDYPRVFHMFWTGPFTDKPYLALLSFLFTQNTGIHLPDFPSDSSVCRSQVWLWINPGPAASAVNPSAATKDMLNQLKSNPWAAPFLHPRFKDVIHFKLWNITEQLDGIPELKEEWRTLKDTLFNSGGHVIKVPAEKPKVSGTGIEGHRNTTAARKQSPTNTGKTNEDDILNRTGSKSATSYDRLSVILSDMARFVLCHRFGGIYLDADTILLRDWEELWGWRGAFAYRWSRLEKYNTAVLKMNKGSALGTFLFRTALKNLLDFHPMTVSCYTKDAYIEGLLQRLPDAMFDSAWLNTEYFQRDRPPQPYFTEFSQFFDTPLESSGAPNTLGFDGFFKGAYSYHFHNFWWKPFDPSRNFPDLGPRFMAGERAARSAAAAASTEPTDDYTSEDMIANDKRDLDWATVLKRTFEAYIRGERPNMYGEWLQW